MVLKNRKTLLFLFNWKLHKIATSEVHFPALENFLISAAAGLIGCRLGLFHHDFLPLPRFSCKQWKCKGRKPQSLQPIPWLKLKWNCSVFSLIMKVGFFRVSQQVLDGNQTCTKLEFWHFLPKKNRQIEARAVLLRKNVNKLSRFF